MATSNRLTAVTGLAPAPKTFQYDAIGNITYKSDVGTYSYPTNGVRPHAVTSTAGILNNTYTYDDLGNMRTGAGRTITYTSFNKPRDITASGLTTAFTYDAAFNRITKVNSQGSTIYVGKRYERVTTPTGTQHRHYLTAGQVTVAVHTVTQPVANPTNKTRETNYLHADHLGSTDVITNDAGNVIENGRQAFDAHGKRRNPTWLDATTPIQIANPTTRGFTGHEMDDESSLINMNARLYDPVLGRFITPDSFVEAAFGQGLNRYTYVLNSPLSLTDPSGFFGEGESSGGVNRGQTTISPDQ